MQTEHFRMYLEQIHWTPQQLAEILRCDISLVEAWMDGRQEIPIRLGVWIRTLAQVHIAAEIPITWVGKKYKA